MSGLTLGVDSGTQSVKVVACDANGGVVATASAPHPAGCVQPPQAWWSALVGACAQLPAVVRNEVGAISVAAQQHGCVPLGPGPSYAVRGDASLWCDTSSAPEAARLNALTDFAATTGSRLVASFTITKLAALSADVAAVALPHDWLTFRLTGRLVTDRGDASGTGWWSDGAGVHRELLALTGRADLVVPEVCAPDEIAGRLTSEAAAAVGLRAGIAVAPGTGDNMAAALGIGAADGELVVSLGTSGTVFAVAPRRTTDPSGTVAGFADATGRFLPLACTLNCTAPVDLLAGWFGTTTEAALDGANLGTSLLFLPYLAGERTPDLPRAAGTLTGLRADSRPSDLVGAAVNGAVHGLRVGRDALVDAGVAAPRSCLLLGGGSRHETWRQAVADGLGLDVACPSGEHHAARGAAAQARAALDGARVRDVAERWRPTAADGARPSGRVHPNGEHTKFAHALQEMWQ